MKFARAKTIPNRQEESQKKEPRRWGQATNSHDFRHWHTTWQLISVFDIPVNLPLSRVWVCLGKRLQKKKKKKTKRRTKESLEENVWWVPASPQVRRPGVIFWLRATLKEHFAEPAAAPESWRLGLQLPASRLGHSSSGTVKWYNIEIYFYADADADDDDHLALEEPVAMALLLAMPIPVRNCLVPRNAVFAVSQCQLAKCQSNANSSSSQWQHRRSGTKILDEL